MPAVVAGLVTGARTVEFRASIDCAGRLSRQLTLVASNAFTHDDLRRTMAMLVDPREQSSTS